MIRPSFEVSQRLREGGVIPASPLALTPRRRLDERRQRALWRYYHDAGAVGIAIGVHTTQFAIRDPKIGLFEPLLALGAEEMAALDCRRPKPLIRVAGVCGRTAQAVREAMVAVHHGYQVALVSLAARRDASVAEMVAHCRAVAEVMPVMGFYLQSAVGGPVLPYRFWREFCEIERAVAIKVAPFDRYKTLDVVRAVAESGRSDIALYTGNDDHIVLDLATPIHISAGRRRVTVRFVGGLLGHWAVWTRRAVELLERCRTVAQADRGIPRDLLQLASRVTEMNAAVFDVAHGYAGCIAGVHEVLRRQGLFRGTWCLDPKERLSPGQREEIARVAAAYPHLTDDDFVRENLDRWLQD